MAAGTCVMTGPRQEQQLFTPGKPPLGPQLDNSLITSTVRKRKVVSGDAGAHHTSHQAAATAGAADEGKRQCTPPVDRGLAHGDAAALVHGASASPLKAGTAAITSPASWAHRQEGGGPAAQQEHQQHGHQQPHEERQQQPGPWQHPRGQQQGADDATATTAAALQAAARHAAAAPHHPHSQPAGGAEQGEQEVLLFSPMFHLHREGSREDLAAAAGGCSQGGAAAAAGADLAGDGDMAADADVAQHDPLAAILAEQHAAAAAAAAAEAAERSSTDHSTGTSAGLAGADGDVSGDAASTAQHGHHSMHAMAVTVTVSVSASSSQHHHQHHAHEAGAEVGAGGGDDADVAVDDAEVAVAATAAAADMDDYLEFDPLLFIKRLPPLERCVPPRREFLLPKKTRRSKQKTLVLDLDETLVHSTLDGYCRPDFTFPVEVGAMRHMVSVRQRPHLHTFLERVSQLYEVVVFTASQRVYAEQLLNIVDPERRLVRHRVYRESCVFWEGNYLKDLTVLGRDLAHTIIVDNSPQAFGFQIDNGIPIESWYDDDGDEELLKLLPFLEKVAGVEDVRPHIQKRYRLRSLVEAAADPDHYLMQQAQAQVQGGQGR